jgi:NADH-quinone oxidoreductase subunit A
MGQYLPVVVLAVLAGGFAAINLVVSRIIAPRSPNTAKELPYECGIVPSRQPPERFPVRFFLIAMIFIVFDVEIIFIYPYVVTYRELGAFGFVELVVFSIAVFSSLVYLIANGALDWGPLKRLERSPQVSAERTSATTIRRVGLEGRTEEVAA